MPLTYSTFSRPGWARPGMMRPPRPSLLSVRTRPLLRRSFQIRSLEADALQPAADAAPAQPELVLRCALLLFASLAAAAARCIVLGIFTWLS
jgi:hypothetical protein